MLVATQVQIHMLTSIPRLVMVEFFSGILSRRIWTLWTAALSHLMKVNLIDTCIEIYFIASNAKFHWRRAGVARILLTCGFAM